MYVYIIMEKFQHGGGEVGKVTVGHFMNLQFRPVKLVARHPVIYWCLMPSLLKAQAVSRGRFQSTTCKNVGYFNLVKSCLYRSLTSASSSAFAASVWRSANVVSRDCLAHMKSVSKKSVLGLCRNTDMQLEKPMSPIPGTKQEKSGAVHLFYVQYCIDIASCTLMHSPNFCLFSSNCFCMTTACS